MFLICLIGLVISLVLSSLLKSFGVFSFFVFGFLYCGAIAILDWLCLSFSPEFLLTLSVVYLIIYVIIWITQVKINPQWILPLLFIVSMIHYCCDGDSFIQSLIYSMCISIILLVMSVFVNISNNEFCESWDIEMPAMADTDIRCPKCGSSRISKSSHCGVSYDVIIFSYYCKRCGKYWEKEA